MNKFFVLINVLASSLLLFTRCEQLDNSSDLIVPDSLVTTHGGISTLDQVPFSGVTFQLDDKGDTLSLISYYRGKLEGIDKAWYAKDIKKHERIYVQGRKEGIHTGWWPNGKLKFRYKFKNDDYEGSVKEWYEDGTMYKSFTYFKGHEEGQQKMWRQDGSIYANYVLKNNRIYGLSGRKNCKSLWKS